MCQKIKSWFSDIFSVLEKRHYAVWISQHERIQVSIYFTWLFPVSFALLPCFGSCPLLSLKQKPHHQESFRDAAFSKDTATAQTSGFCFESILFWTWQAISICSAPASIQFNYQQKLGKCKGFWKKCLRTDKWSVWIALPRSRGWAVELPTAAISRAGLSFSRCGIFSVDKALLHWPGAHSHVGIAPVRREIPVLSSAFPAKFSPYCITFKYCYCSEDGYRQHQEEENQQPIPKWCI